MRGQNPGSKEPALRKRLWVNPFGIHETGPALRKASLRHPPSHLIESGARSLCRTYGARACWELFPALTRWAKLCRANGAWKQPPKARRTATAYQLQRRSETTTGGETNGDGVPAPTALGNNHRRRDERRRRTSSNGAWKQPPEARRTATAYQCQRRLETSTEG
jgi:hypothetical protein